MPNIIKKEQGLLFEEDFNNPSLIWTLSPSNANNLSFENGKLRIKHIDEYVTYTIIEPDTDEYACIVKIDHAPYDVNDIAGVIILHTNKQYIECQTFLASASSKIGTRYTLSDLLNELDLSSEYPRYQINEGDSDDSQDDDEDNPDFHGDVRYNYIKVHKKNGVYSFYASNDNKEWIEVGDVGMSKAGAIGFFIYGGDKDTIENSHCYIEEFNMYKGKYIRISGIPQDSNFEIHDGEHIICRSDTPSYNNTIKYFENGVLINTTMMKMPINNLFIRFFEKDNFHNTLEEYNLGKVYGGDEFEVSTDVRFYLNSQEIFIDEITDLGSLYINKSYIKIEIKNCDTINATSRTINVERFSDYYAGSKPILICITKENQIPEYNMFSDSAIIPELQPEETVNLYLCLKEKAIGDYFLHALDLRFKLVIT